MGDDYNSNFSFSNAISLSSGEIFFGQIFSKNYQSILVNTLNFMELDDIINLKLSCKIAYKSLNKKAIKKFVRNGKISCNTRLSFWTANIDYSFVQKQVEKRITDINCFSDSLYEKINISYNKDKNLNKLNKELIEFVSVINKDLTRTIHSKDEKLNMEKNNKLENILIMTAYIRPEIGYCQGMNFVAGALLNFLNNEELTFWLFITLLDKFELNLLYSQVRVAFLNHRICQIIRFDYFK